MNPDPSLAARERPQSRRNYWLGVSVFIVFFYVVGHLPHPWGAVSPIAAGIVFSLGSAVVVLVRTRWVFRRRIQKGTRSFTWTPSKAHSITTHLSGAHSDAQGWNLRRRGCSHSLLSTYPLWKGARLFHCSWSKHSGITAEFSPS